MNKSKLIISKNILIVVDMINGFVKEGALSNSNIAKIVPSQVKIVEQFIEKNEPIIFVRDSHPYDSIEFFDFPVHCLKGSKESRLIDELMIYESHGETILKNSTSAMFAPGFIDYLEECKRLRQIIITGCCTDICITNLAIPLKNYYNEQNRPIDIVVPTAIVSTYNSIDHPADLYQEMSLRLMRQAGIRVVNNLDKI